MSAVVPRPLADADGPGAVGQVYRPGYLFLVQWADPIELATAFDTSVTQAQTLAEERKGLLSRPTRVGELSLVALAEREAWQLQMFVTRFSQADSLVPLFADFTKITVAASGSVLTCDTTERRFFEGARVIIAELRNRATLADFEVVTIAAGGVAPGALTLTGSVARTYPVGSRVYPAIEARLSLAGSSEVVTDRDMTSRLNWSEHIGASQLPGLADVGTTPSGFLTYAGEVIMHVTPDWSRHTTGPRRIARGSRAGRGVSTATWGARPLVSKSLGWQFVTRAAAFQVLRFFDSRGGRLHPFLLPSFLDDFTPLALGTITVDVTPNGPVFDYAHTTHLAIFMRDETLVVREIDSVARLSSSVDQITLDTALPSGLLLADVRRVSACHRVRFDRDELAEIWQTNHAVTIACPVVEVINEKNVTLLDTSQPAQAGAPDGVPDLSGWYDAALECLGTDTTNGTGEGDPCLSVQEWDTPNPGQGSGTASIPVDAYKKRVAFWKDQSGNGRILKRNSVGSRSNRVIYRNLFGDPWSTDLPIIMPHMYATLADSLNQAPTDYAWHDDTDGLTVFCVGGNRDFQGLYDTSDSPMFESTSRWQMRTKRWKLIGNTTVDLAFTATKVWSIFTGIWTPSVSAKVWRNGQLLNSTVASVPATLGGISDFTVCGQYARLAAAVIYARALTVLELNTVGLYLSVRYGIPWTTIT